MAEAVRVILASGSPVRRAMLAAAGVTFDVVPAGVDEAGIRKALPAHYLRVTNSDIAATLAAAKAASVSKQNPEALVIGSDQVLTMPLKIFSKAENKDEARAILCELRGQTHMLMSAAAIATRGLVVWQTRQTAHMTMRNFSDEFLEDYLARAGDCLTNSVGAYAFEGLGSQLFERVEGDYFTILGMPLLPLLDELRQRGVLES